MFAIATFTGSLFLSTLSREIREIYPNKYIQVGSLSLQSSNPCFVSLCACVIHSLVVLCACVTVSKFVPSLAIALVIHATVYYLSFLCADQP